MEDKVGEHEIRIASTEAACNNMNHHLVQKVQLTTNYGEDEEYSPRYNRYDQNSLEILEGNLNAKYDGVITIKCNQFFKKFGNETLQKFEDMKENLQNKLNEFSSQTK